MGLQFGTDGLRGVANADLTPEVVLTLGRAAARVLGAPTFLTGADTRRSSALLERALAAGIAGEGADVVEIGVLPTPGLAYLAQRRAVPAAVVSASHNPFPDNGIKLIGADGRKLPLAAEQAVERELLALLAGSGRITAAPTGAAIGRIVSDEAARADYEDHLARLVDLAGSGLSVVVDCANGAASEVAPSVLRRVGLDPIVICAAPDGININAGCGSTSPGALVDEVRRRGADLGIAFDGDADRLVAVDHTGTVVDGDRLLVLFARDLKARGELAGDGIVVTVMSNLGLRHALEPEGIAVVEVPVGDRNVVDAMRAHGFVLGGEQSGHIVFGRLATTGDGLLSAVSLLDLVRRAGRPLAELAAAAMESVPQVLVNVSVARPAQLYENPAIWSAVARLEDELGDAGRVVLRPSGTEQAVRVMVEASAPGRAGEIAAELAELVRSELEGAAPEA